MRRAASASVSGRMRPLERPWVVTFSPGFWSHRPRWWQVAKKLMREVRRLACVP